MNWLEPSNARVVRSQLERISDVILTGHEHEHSHRKVETVSGDVSYVEGHVLQDRDDPTRSAFNLILVDTTAQKQKVLSVKWNGERYLAASAKDWEGFRTRHRKGSEFQLKPKTIEFIESPGVDLTHRDRGVLKLSDVFVFPDVREIRLLTQQQGELVKADGIIGLLKQKPKLLLSGESQSGRTSLGKMLFSRLLDQGIVPVWLRGQRRPPQSDGLSRYVEGEFSEQYEPGSLDRYSQHDRRKKAIIVDDFHKIPLNGKARHAFVSNLAMLADTVVLLADDVAQNLTDVMRPSGDATFSHYHIQPFGRVQRNEMIEKWFSLSDNYDADGPEVARRLVEIDRQLDVILGKNFVPPFPIYILAILQGAEAATPIDTNASTHGYFFELFVRLALSKNRSKGDYDIAVGYLSFFAHRLHGMGVTELAEDEWRRINAEYVERYEIERPFERVRDELMDQRVISKSGERYQFKHRYLLYYFTANYMRDHISRSDIQVEIKTMARALYRTRYANIMLFLAHLSKDPSIVREMLNAARDSFSDIDSARLADDVGFINDLEALVGDLVYEEKAVSDARRELALARDEHVQGTEAEDDRDGDAIDPARAAVDPIMRMNGALKTLQVLGQSLKNFPGSLEADTKFEIAKECYGIGLRALGMVFRLLKNNEEEIVADVIAMVRERFPTFKDDEVRERAQATLVMLARMVTFGLVKRVASSVGSPALTTTYERLLSDSPTVAVRLIDVAIALENNGTFPEGLVKELARDLKDNALARDAVGRIVVEHFYLFGGDRALKQRMCTLLGVEYKALQVPDVRRLLTSN